MTTFKKLPPVETVRSLLDYDHETGVFIWRERAGNPQFNEQFAGKIAGSAKPGTGYWLIRVNGVNYSAGRLAWLHVTGEAPAGEIDHIDNNRRNNKFSNLRDIPHAANMKNRSTYKSSATGIKGVRPYQTKYAASICNDGKRLTVGYFDTIEEAAAAYAHAAVRLFGEFASEEAKRLAAETPIPERGMNRNIQLHIPGMSA